MEKQVMKYDGDSYFPSNGTEGEFFISTYCENCVHCHPDPTKQPQCEILCDSMALSRDEFHSKHEKWIYVAGGATCIDFSSWDWGNEDDGWNEPPTNPENPDDPNQLLLPFDITALFGFNDLVVTKQAIIEEELL